MLGSYDQKQTTESRQRPYGNLSEKKCPIICHGALYSKYVSTYDLRVQYYVHISI